MIGFGMLCIVLILGMLAWYGLSTLAPNSAPTSSVVLDPPTPVPFTQMPSALPVVIQSSQPPTALAASAWVPLPPLPADSYRLITNGDRSKYKVALTFDLCEREGELTDLDTEIVRVLNEAQAPATFFAGGLWMKDHEAQLVELASNPLFEIGNHSWSHKDFSAISPEEMVNEIVQTQQYMYKLLQYQTRLFRLPYGTYNEDALRVIAEQGLYAIQWDDVSGDPDPNIDAQRMIPWVLQQVQPGSIVIMHANGRGWHTAEALPAIIQSIREQGYELVTVSDLLKLPYP